MDCIYNVYKKPLQLMTRTQISRIKDKSNPNYLGYDEDHYGDFDDYFNCPKCREHNYIIENQVFCGLCDTRLEWVDHIIEVKKVYGIYQGCKHEDVAVRSIVYYSKEEARKEALSIVEKENKYIEEEEVINVSLFEEIKPNRWDRDTDIIKIIEFVLK